MSIIHIQFETGVSSKVVFESEIVYEGEEGQYVVHKGDPSLPFPAKLSDDFATFDLYK
jgi:hypothetical protein